MSVMKSAFLSVQAAQHWAGFISLGFIEAYRNGKSGHNVFNVLALDTI